MSKGVANKITHTDIVLIYGFPILTLEEHFPFGWICEELDLIYHKTANGFRPIIGSHKKKILERYEKK